MALWFHLDEDAEAHALIHALRVRGVNLTTTSEVGLTGTDDRSQLIWASAQGRVLFTHNGSDFCRLHGEFLQSGQHHAGIVVAGQQRLSVGERMRRILRLSATLDAGMMRDRVEFLSHW